MNIPKLVTCLIIVISSTTSLALATSIPKCNTTNTLITKECNSTHFPQLCCISLAPLASTINDKLGLCAAVINATLSTHLNTVNMLVDMTNDDGIIANTTEDAFYGIINCMLDFKDASVPISRSNVTFNATNVESIVNEFKDWIFVAIDKYKFCFRELDDSGLTGPLKKKIVDAVIRALKLARITLSIFKSLKLG